MSAENRLFRRLFATAAVAIPLVVLYADTAVTVALRAGIRELLP